MSCSARIKMLPLQGLLWLYLIFFGLGHSTLQPGYLDFDNLPDTNFSCIGKVIGGYYADLEANCQMFHVCTIGQHDEPMDIRFLCLNGTVFDQETRVCERVDEVDCSKSEKFYSLNLELYGNTAPPILEEPPETESPSPSSTTTKRPTTTSRTTTYRPTTFRPSTFGYRPPVTTSTTTVSPPRTTSPGPKVITSHHFPVSEPASTKNQDPFREINLNPDTPPDIRFDPRQPISFQHSAFNGGETHITVTTHTTLYKDNQNYQRPHQTNKPSGFQQTNYPQKINQQPLYERPENTQDNKFVGFPHLITLKDGPTQFKFPQLLQQQTTTENYILTTPQQSSLLIRLRNHQKTSTTQRPYAQHSSNKNELVFRQKFPVSESDEEDDANSHQFNRQTPKPANRPYHSQTNEPFSTHYLPQLEDDNTRNHQITFRANNAPRGEVSYQNSNSNYDANIHIDHPHGHSTQEYEGNNKPQGFHYQTRGPSPKPTHRIPEGPRRPATQRVVEEPKRYVTQKIIDESRRPVTQRIVEESRRSTLRIIDEPITQRIVAEASQKVITEGESRRPDIPDEETEKVVEDLKKVIIQRLVSEEPRRTVAGTAASTASIKTEAPPKLQIPLPIAPINLPQPFTLDSRHFETKRHQPSLPRVIVSASATVSDASGRKLNITLGTIDPIHVLGTPPSSYDDYKEEDVVLDPFYHDVKKIKNKKLKRDVEESNINLRDNSKRKRSSYDEFIIEDPREFNENLQPVTQNSVPVVTNNGLPKFRGLRKRSAVNLKLKRNVDDFENGATTHWTPPDYVDDNYEPTVYNESVETDIFSDGNYDEYDYPTSEDTIVFEENGTDRNVERAAVDYFDVMSDYINDNYTVGNNISKTNITTEKYAFDESKAFTSMHLNSLNNNKNETYGNNEFSISTTTEKHSKTTAATVLIPKLNVDGEDPVEMAENEEIKEIENCTKSKFVDNKILLTKDDLYNIFENDTMTTEYPEETTEFNNNSSSFEDHTFDDSFGYNTTTDIINAVVENRSVFDSSTSLPATTIEGGDLEFRIFTSETNNSKKDATTTHPENSNSTYEQFNINDTSLPLLSKERSTGFSSSEENSTENFLKWDRSFDDSTTDSETEKHPISILQENMETTEMLLQTTENDFSRTTETGFNTENFSEFSHSEFTTIETSIDKETTENIFSITTTEIPVTEKYNISTMETMETTTTIHTIDTPSNDTPSTDTPTTSTPTTTEKRVIEKTTSRHIYNRPRKYQSVSDFLRNSAKGRPHFGSNHNFGVLPHNAPHVKDATVKESIVSEMKITFNENLTGQILNSSNPGSEKELKDTLSSIMLGENPVNMSDSFELNSSTEMSDLIQTTVIPPEDSSNDENPLKSTSPLLLRSAIPTNNPNLQSDNLQRTTLSLLSVSSTENVLKNIDRFKLSFTCLGKKLNQFYNDVRDCRLFHYCSPGYSPTQVLDLKFVCDKGTFFDFQHLKCSTEKPRDCL